MLVSAEFGGEQTLSSRELLYHSLESWEQSQIPAIRIQTTSRLVHIPVRIFFTNSNSIKKTWNLCCYKSNSQMSLTHQRRVQSIAVSSEPYSIQWNNMFPFHEQRLDEFYMWQERNDIIKISEIKKLLVSCYLSQVHTISQRCSVNFVRSPRNICV